MPRKAANKTAKPSMSALLKYRISLPAEDLATYSMSNYERKKANGYWDTHVDGTAKSGFDSDNWQILDAWLGGIGMQALHSDGFRVWNATGGDVRDDRHLVGIVPVTKLVAPGYCARRSYEEIEAGITGLIMEYESGERAESGQNVREKQK